MRHDDQGDSNVTRAKLTASRKCSQGRRCVGDSKLSLNDIRHNHRKCVKCRIKEAKEQDEKRKARIKEGRCSLCGLRPLVKGLKRCFRCRLIKLTKEEKDLFECGELVTALEKHGRIIRG